MPSEYSSEHSKGDAAELARRTGLNFRTVPIEPMSTRSAPLGLTGLAEENLQSRLRGTMLMAVSNQEGHIVLAGQQEGAGGRLLDAVRRLGGRLRPDQGRVQDVGLPARPVAQRRGRSGGETPPIPENSITKPPSAELRPGQMDTDSLPDYAVLDAILELYVDRDRACRRIVARATTRAGDRVLRMVERRSTSGASTRRARRSRRRASGRTGGCLSRTAGAKVASRSSPTPGCPTLGERLARRSLAAGTHTPAGWRCQSSPLMSTARLQ